jgi:pyruvate dehydrogenase E2 component (dihydrolipoamide acetyltransferase)
MEDNDIDPADIDLAQGTGYEGGINEKDVMEYAKKNSVRITPVARNLAKLNKIDIKTVTGTGAMGKIMKEDIEKLITDEEAASVPAVQGIAAGSDSKRILETVPYSDVRKIIGDRLAESKFTAPHVYFKKSVDMTEVIAFRKTVNEKQDHKTSVTDYIAMAASKALQKYPDINSALIGDEIIKYESANVGIAVAADSGLIVPVVKNTQDKSLVTVSKEFKELVVKAREGKLLPTDYSDGTFTISNLGMFGVEEFTAIINPPESAILSVSATFDKAVVVEVDGEKLIKIRPVMNIVLSVDHRIIDGLLAAQFVGEIQRLLENPFELVL